MAALVPSLRLRTVALAALFGFTTFFVSGAPTEAPLPRPEALSPQPANAAYCAGVPSFEGHLTNTASTTAIATYSTTGNVYGYISEVVDDWSCTSFLRYDGLVWMRDDDELDANFDWGALINSTSIACNWAIGSTDYLKANATTDCPDTDAEYALPIFLSNWQTTMLEAVWRSDPSPDNPGEFTFVHTDCDSWYFSEALKENVTWSTASTTNRPGVNCDPYAIESTDTTQAIAVDATPPQLAFDWPAAGGPALVTSAFGGVQFDAVDPVAGFSDASHDWDLQRQKATWSGSACGTFVNDTTTGHLTSGTTDGADLVVSQSLADATCYRWTLAARDANGNTATTITSGSIRTDLSRGLGRRSHHTFETWGLGAGDTLSINVGTGNLVLDHPVLDVPIRGGSYGIDLTYNRHDTTNVGMGPGWRLDVFRRLAVNGDGSVTYTDGDGSRHTFTNPTGTTVKSYTRPASLYATLVRDTGATPDRFTLTWRDGGFDLFDELAANTAYLVRDEDRHGNAMTFTYDGSQQLTRIEDPTSRDIDLTWTSGKVTAIRDWAVVSGGVVQTSGTPNRTHRFFYSGADLRGWADPLAPTGDCTAGGSHITCLTLGATQLDIAKTQTYEYLNATPDPDVIATSTKTVTSKVTFVNADVVTVKDAQEVQNATAGTAFSHTAPRQTQIVRRGTSGASPDTTTRYTLGTGGDVYSRIATVARKLGSTWITTATTWNGTYPMEVASVTGDAGGSLERTVSNTWSAGTIGPNLTRVVEPITTTDDRWTDHVYNANHDVTETRVSLEGSSDPAERTITRFCYGSACNTGDAGDELLRIIENYVDKTAGGANGHVEDVTVEYQVDAYGQRTRETRQNYASGGTLLDSRATAFEYDTNGNLTKEIANYVSGTVTDPGDDITPNATTNARTDLTTVHAYDSAGNRVSSADPRRAIEVAKGTSLGADDFITRWTYDALGQRVSELTPTTPAITISCASTSPDCRRGTWSYDEFGAVRRSTDFGNLLGATFYDRAGRVLESFEDPPDVGGTKPATTTGESTVDPIGRTLTARDQAQVADSSRGYTAFEYDELGRQVGVAEAVGTGAALATLTGYDTLDRAVSVTLGANTATAQTTVTRYHQSGLVYEVDDEFTCKRTVYDYRGNPTGVREGITPGGVPCAGEGTRRLTNTWDGLGRLTRTVVDTGEGAGDWLVDDSFDATGNKRTSSAVIGGETTTVTSTTNLLDQTIAESRTDGSISKSNYDPVGNVADSCYWASVPSPAEACKAVGSSFTTAPTRHTTTTFDARNNRVRLRDAATNAITLYDPDHNYQVQATYLPTKMSGTNVDVEHQSTFTYDERHRLTGIVHQRCTRSAPTDPDSHGCSSTAATGSVGYSYDANDNRTLVDEDNGATSSDRRYCYDAQDRLVYRNTGAACSSSAKDEEYQYDASGNRTKAVVGSTTDFAYNASGQLCKVGATTCGTPNVTYDSAGRTASWDGWYLKYDAHDRLVKACQDSGCTTGADQVRMAYDGEGRRTKVVIDPASGDTVTRSFRYQGEAIVEERVKVGAGAETVSQRYLVDESGSIVEVIIPSGANAGTYVVNWNGHGDALGLWRIKADGTLEKANTYTHSTWGKPFTNSGHINSSSGVAYGDLGFRFLYVGEFDVRWDDELGLDLLYMHARHYSPALARFLQPDPDRSEANLYAYAANNPVTEIDPDGTCFIVCAVINAAIDVAIYAATTDNFDLGEAAGVAAVGAVTGALGVGLLSKVGKIGAAAGKVLSKFPKASRAVSKTKSGYRRLEEHYSWRNVRARNGPAEWRPNSAFPRGREYKELTHAFIPKRAKVPNFIKNSKLNLREKWGTNHARSDPSRYRFMPKTWKKANPLPNVVRRSWNRMWAD
jgi:RHS repeat-associated protein